MERGAKCSNTENPSPSLFSLRWKMKVSNLSTKDFICALLRITKDYAKNCGKIGLAMKCKLISWQLILLFNNRIITVKMFLVTLLKLNTHFPNHFASDFVYHDYLWPSNLAEFLRIYCYQKGSHLRSLGLPICLSSLGTEVFQTWH